MLQVAIVCVVKHFFDFISTNKISLIIVETFMKFMLFFLNTEIDKN